MDCFPINIAQGKAFCNRTEERYLLEKLIMNGRHTVIVAPRRYGKSSLINQVLLDLKLPHAMMELTMATTFEDIEKIVVKHVSDLLYVLLPKSSKAKQKMLGLFKWLNPELVLSAKGQKVIFHPDWSQLEGVNSIVEILRSLDQAAVLSKKRVVVVMDEFQQLCEIEGASSKSEFVIEAAIRNAMQYAKNTSYIFSGSHRNMLLSMFDKKNRPFYNSCEIMTIHRINREEHQSFIQSAATKKWRKKLPEKVVSKILDLTHCHSHYVNRLCGYFWLIDKAPTLISVQSYWDKFVESKHGELTGDFLGLSKNQKKVLAFLAGNPVKQPSSAYVCNTVSLSEASVRQALKVLSAKDYIHKNDAGFYAVLDPAMQYMLNKQRKLMD